MNLTADETNAVLPTTTPAVAAASPPAEAPAAQPAVSTAAQPPETPTLGGAASATTSPASTESATTTVRSNSPVLLSQSCGRVTGGTLVQDSGAEDVPLGCSVTVARSSPGGIENADRSSCFMSAVVNCLAHTPGFADLLQRSAGQNECTAELAKLVSGVLRPDGRVQSSTGLRAAIGVVNALLATGMHDPTDFFRVLLGQLSDSVVDGMSLQIRRSETACNRCTIHLSEECCVNSFPSILPNASKYVGDGLKKLINDTALSKCSTCAEQVADTQLTVSWPEMLVVNSLGTTREPLSASPWDNKENIQVTVVLPGGEVTYKLVGVCGFNGSRSHYVAHVLQGGAWYLVDDAKVVLEAGTPLLENACLMFYSRTSFVVASAASTTAQRRPAATPSTAGSRTAPAMTPTRRKPRRLVLPAATPSTAGSPAAPARTPTRRKPRSLLLPKRRSLPRDCKTKSVMTADVPDEALHYKMQVERTWVTGQVRVLQLSVHRNRDA